MIDWITASIPADKSMPFDRSLKPFIPYLAMYLVIATFGIFLNSISLYLFFRTEKSKVDLYTFTVALNITDLLYCFYRVAMYSKWIVQFDHHMSISFECQSDAFINNGCFFFSIYLIIWMSYITRIELTQGIKTSDETMMKMIVGSCTYLVTILVIALFLTNTLMKTAGYCHYNLNSTAGTILQFPTVFIPFGFLTYNINVIYSFVKKSQRQLIESGMKMRAKSKYVYMAFKFISFLVSTLISLLPTEIDTIYGYLTGYQLQSKIFFPLSFLSTFSNAIVNPGLFLYLNYDLQVAFWNDFGQYLSFLKGIGKIFGCAYFHISSIYDSNIDYNKWETWMSEPSLLPIFQKHSEQNYVGESPMFYNEIEEFKFMILESGEIDENLINFINDKVNKIYSLYIQVPNAPLEINISADMRKRIENKFEKKANGELVYDARKSIIEGRWEESNMFDESQQEIGRIIESDIFPRFSKSKIFYQTVKGQSEENINDTSTIKEKQEKRSVASFLCSFLQRSSNYKVAPMDVK